MTDIPDTTETTTDEPTLLVELTDHDCTHGRYATVLQPATTERGRLLQESLAPSELTGVPPAPSGLESVVIPYPVCEELDAGTWLTERELSRRFYLFVAKALRAFKQTRGGFDV